VLREVIYPIVISAEVLKDSLIKKKWGENEVFYPQEIKK
jgi:hypothetical protein